MLRRIARIGGFPPVYRGLSCGGRHRSCEPEMAGQSPESEWKTRQVGCKAAVVGFDHHS